MSLVEPRPETMLRVGEVELCVQEFGTPTDPAILLIGGATTSMDWWDDELCARLAAGGRRVVRYDQRDTGRSTSWPAGRPTYTHADLVADAVGLIGALGLAPAHVIGMSMGGAVAQRLAVGHPELVASLTLIATSPGGQDGELPKPAPWVNAAFDRPSPHPDWSDREAVIDQLVIGEFLFRGGYPVDEDRVRRIAGRMYDRTRDIAASRINHRRLVGGPPIRPRLGEVRAPTLVLHGTRDPLFPLAHAEALAAAIPGARLLPLAEVGHQVPPPETWPQVVPEILAHTARVSGGR